MPAGTGIPQGEAIWEPGHWGFQVFHGITPESETTTHQFRYILHEKGNADAATIAEFYRQNDQIINEDRVIFAIQQNALLTAGDGASAADLKTSVIIKADGGLILRFRSPDMDGRAVPKCDVGIHRVRTRESWCDGRNRRRPRHGGRPRASRGCSSRSF